MMTPKTEAELAQMIASSDGPLHIRGGGTRGIAGMGEVLETTGLSGIELYEPGALTLVARAGTPLAEVEAELDRQGQMLPFEPFVMGEGSTIGGVFAANVSGARRVQCGAARDFLLGVRFVDGSGTIIKNGGRVMKNVTGYDLVKLLAGSHGTLGALSEVSFKVLPKPETTGTVQLSGLDDAQAMAAMTAAMNTPYDVSGAVHLSGAEPKTVIRVEGFEGSVRHRLDGLKAVLGRFGDVDEIPDDVWADLRQLAFFEGTPDTVWKVGIKPSDAAGFAAQIMQEHEISRAYDWAGGRVWIGAHAGADAKDKIEALHTRLQGLSGDMAAHTSLMRAPVPIAGPRFQPEVPAVAALTAGIRAKFDPRGILNPGVMDAA